MPLRPGCGPDETDVSGLVYELSPNTTNPVRKYIKEK